MRQLPSHDGLRGFQGEQGLSRSQGRGCVSAALLPATLMPSRLRGSLELVKAASQQIHQSPSSPL